MREETGDEKYKTEEISDWDEGGQGSPSADNVTKHKGKQIPNRLKTSIIITVLSLYSNIRVEIKVKLWKQNLIDILSSFLSEHKSHC